MVCPICTARNGGRPGQAVGTGTYGFSSHLHKHHGPRGRHPEPEPGIMTYK